MSKYASTIDDVAHEEESYFVSMTDIMVGLLFIFIILVMFFAFQIRDTEENTVPEQQYVALQQQHEAALKLISNLELQVKANAKEIAELALQIDSKDKEITELLQQNTSLQIFSRRSFSHS